MDQSPVRILHVFGSMNRGGAETRTLEVMRKIDRSRFQLEFCTLAGKPGDYDDEIRSLGGVVHSIPLGLSFPTEFVRFLRREKFDIVHSNVQLASGVMLSLAALAGVRNRIAHFHSTGDEHADSWARSVYRGAMRVLVDRYATAILGCSEGALVHGWKPTWSADPRCRVLFYGVDASAFALPTSGTEVRREFGIPDHAPLAIHVGRFDPPKNQARTVDVFAAANHRNPAHLLLVGRGGTPIEDAARDRVRAHGLEARVHFAGERRDVPRLLNAANVMLLTSLWEGLPGVVLESVAAGTPVVANDLPGVVEIARNIGGVATLALDAADHRWGELISQHLERPPSDDERAAARARFHASTFSITSWVSGNVRVWAGAS